MAPSPPRSAPARGNAAPARRSGRDEDPGSGRRRIPGQCHTSLPGRYRGPGRRSPRQPGRRGDMLSVVAGSGTTDADTNRPCSGPAPFHRSGSDLVSATRRAPSAAASTPDCSGSALESPPPDPTGSWWPDRRASPLGRFEAEVQRRAADAGVPTPPGPTGRRRPLTGWAASSSSGPRAGSTALAGLGPCGGARQPAPAHPPTPPTSSPRWPAACTPSMLHWSSERSARRHRGADHRRRARRAPERATAEDQDGEISVGGRGPPAPPTRRRHEGGHHGDLHRST